MELRIETRLESEELKKQLRTSCLNIFPRWLEVLHNDHREKMMKLALLSLILLFQIKLLAQNQDQLTCSQQIYSQDDWSNVPAEMTQCLSTNQELQNSLLLLCHANLQDLTPVFKAYLKYKNNFELAQAHFNSLPESQRTARAINKLRNAREDWDILGSKYQVDTALNKLRKESSFCKH